jgi:hypothetical protein
MNECSESSRVSLWSVLRWLVAIIVLIGFTKVWPFSLSGLFFFWLALFAPIWFPSFAVPGHGHTPFLRRVWCLVSVAWFFIEYAMWSERAIIYSITRNSALIRGFVIVGTLIALAALMMSARGWRHLVTVPLWIAILAGSLSVFVLYGY